MTVTRPGAVTTAVVVVLHSLVGVITGPWASVVGFFLSFDTEAGVLDTVAFAS